VRVSSSDGVDVAVHDLGGHGAPLLFSHATGFHGRCYQPVAHELAGEFRSAALDYRGHGESTTPTGWDGEPLDWTGCGDDAVVAAEAVAPDGGLVGFGHSMGGAALLMAAARRPGLFARLVLFEPVVFPRHESPVDMEELPIVQGARRRRRAFESTRAAYDNFRSKPPMSIFDPDALHAYVDHGFRPVDPGDPAAGVELRCTPEFEAATFVGSFSNPVWNRLPEIDIPVLVIAGAIEGDQPARFAAPAADLLPRGRYLELPHLTHFAPFTHIAELATLIRST
jgi:pimeloyl-ACP methyl ester carboxylesterase